MTCLHDLFLYLVDLSKWHGGFFSVVYGSGHLQNRGTVQWLSDFIFVLCLICLSVRHSTISCYYQYICIYIFTCIIFHGKSIWNDIYTGHDCIQLLVILLGTSLDCKTSVVNSVTKQFGITGIKWKNKQNKTPRHRSISNI